VAQTPFLVAQTKTEVVASLGTRILGRATAEDLVAQDGAIIVAKGQTIDLGGGAAEDAGAERRHDLTRVDDRAHPDAVVGAATKGQTIEEKHLEPITKAGIQEVKIRSVLVCATKKIWAAPPMWKVRIVSWVPGSPIDCAAMTPTASPMWPDHRGEAPRADHQGRHPGGEDPLGLGLRDQERRS
jgi:hypothetical protein